MTELSDLLLAIEAGPVRPFTPEEVAALKQAVTGGKREPAAPTPASPEQPAGSSTTEEGL